MFKIIYLPTAETVNTLNRLPACRDYLDLYIENGRYYFFRSKLDTQIHMGIAGSGKYMLDILEGDQEIKKHLLEIIEVPDV